MDPNDPKIVDVDLERSEEILEDEGEHDLGNEAETKFVPIFIHLGGRFIQGAGNSILYVDGECDDWIINRDKLTLFELYTKIGITGYDVDMVDQIWYLEPRKTITDGLKPIRNDHDIRDVLGVLKVEKKVHIYVSHVPNFAEIMPILPLPAPSDKGTVADNPVKVEGRVENDHVDVEGRVEDAGHAVDVEGRVEDAGRVVEVEGRVEDAGHAVEVEGRVEDDGNEDNEHSEDEDDFLPYISELSDNEDKETVEARNKMKSLHEATSRSKNARKGVNHEIPSSSTGHNDLGPEDSLSSDDDISYISTSEEDGSEVEHGRRRKGRHKVFRGTDDGNVQIELGMVFLNKAEFKKAVDKLSIMQRRPIKWVKNDKKRHMAICNERHYDWKILLAWDKPIETWMVKTFTSEHTCEWGSTNRRCNSTFAMNHLFKTKRFSVVYLKSGDSFIEIWDELNMELTQVQCRIIKRRLRKTFEGDHSLEYNKLFDYAAELRKRDPRATVSIYAPRPLPELNPIFLRICVKALNEAESNATLAELGKLKPAARDDIMNVDPKHWSIAFFKAKIKSSVVDKNMCEVFNALLVDARHKAIISMNQEMRAMCAARTIIRREFGSDKFVGEFGLKIWTKIVWNREGSKKCKVLWPGGGGFEVEDYMNSKNKVDSSKNTYIVYLENRKCTCRYWDISGIPCRLAMTVLSLKKLRVEEYVSDWYKLSRFRASYAYEVPVIEGMNQWTPTGMPAIQPPVPRKMPGRLKKKRNPEEWEGKKKIGRQGRQMTCQKCFQKSHNSRSCKGQPLNVPQMENEPSVEQPPPVEDNQPRIAEEELVNMTQEDPLVSQVVSPTPPVQQATTPTTRKKERARSADQPKVEKRARKNTLTPTVQEDSPSVPPSETHSQSTKTQKVKHAYPKGKGKQQFEGFGTYVNPNTSFSKLNPGHRSERNLSFGYAQKRATGVGDRGIPVVTLTHAPTTPAPTAPTPITPTVPTPMAPPSITTTTPSRSSKQFVTATNLQAQLWEKRRQKEWQKEEEALGRWVELLTKIHTDKQSNV
ncbi:hypothetical protein SLEP1_g33142 [Rubroshorea leprosula]|uniref:SWIM-type domain-containing protein n=1 Tax=Rubroshorea leprosula TaxID=152421 RepID=A0AAV5KFP0_9ROSI|nr:hypothetical protein SLEP1_g33142 [Rubroshorea leprosula]